MEGCVDFCPVIHLLIDSLLTLVVPFTYGEFLPMLCSWQNNWTPNSFNTVWLIFSELINMIFITVCYFIRSTKHIYHVFSFCYSLFFWSTCRVNTWKSSVKITRLSVCDPRILTNVTYNSENCWRDLSKTHSTFPMKQWQTKMREDFLFCETEAGNICSHSFIWNCGEYDVRRCSLLNRMHTFSCSC